MGIEIYGLIVGAAVFALGTRWVILAKGFGRTKKTAANCPKCGGHLYRTERSSRDKFFGLVLVAKMRHFRCSECSYSGLMNIKKG